MQGKGVNVLTTEAFQGCDQVRANALGREVTVQVGLWVEHPGAAIAAHGYAGHRLDATDHHQVLEAGTHFHRPQVHRLKARGAEAVDLETGDADVPVRHQRGGLGDVGALVAHRGDAAED